MLKQLFPWFDEEKEQKKDERVDVAVERAKSVEDRVRRLAVTYHASAIVVQKVRNHV